MPVRENSILSPREEMHELKVAIEGEKETRKSLQISGNRDYYNRQKAILLEQLEEIKRKIDCLDNRFHNVEDEMQASLDRQAKYERRYKTLKNRDKIARLEKLLEKERELKLL